MTTTLPPDAVTYAAFIAAFPEFTSTATYPQAQVDFWFPHAYAQLNWKRFGSELGLGVMLFVAHNLVLSARAAKSATTGAVVGTQQGILTSKSVGDVSAGYDAASVTIQGAGIWNSTTYGARLYKMMQSYGTGPAYAPGPRRFTRFPYGYSRFVR